MVGVWRHERGRIPPGAASSVFGVGSAPRCDDAHRRAATRSKGRTRPAVRMPMGRILNDALKEAASDRPSTYVTNFVKHFKREARGKRRIHKTLGRYEIENIGLVWRPSSGLFVRGWWYLWGGSQPEPYRIGRLTSPMFADGVRCIAFSRFVDNLLALCEAAGSVRSAGG